MCGIIGYVGIREAYPILLQGLERLEYRGYDSAGIATSAENSILVKKTVGRVGNLKEQYSSGRCGIAHTRWATHGKPSDQNAHPFTDAKNQLVVVHNGIIENHLELKEELRKKGVQFSSETDSEVIVHLLAESYSGDLREAVLKTVLRLQGTFAFLVLKHDGEEMVGARNGSPLVVGLGKGENFLASDVSALIEHTKKVVYLHDYEIVQVDKDTISIFDFQGKPVQREVKVIDWDIEQAQKQGYKHFMLKEILEQPTVIKNSLPGRLVLPQPLSRICIVACGTASHAGLVGKYIIEEVAKIQVMNETASEFRYKEPLLSSEDIVIAISQSGETADTLAAVRLAKEKKLRTLGIINVMDSTIAREVDAVMYTQAGPEIGVASTKAFTAQLIMLYKLAFQLAGKEMDNSFVRKILQAVDLRENIRAVAEKYQHYNHFLYIGRNRNFPLALEGALKLKEISYIHAEAYPAGELKHGPIALVSEDMPTVALCPQDEVYEKMLSNIQEIKARNGKVIAIATAGDEKIKTIADEVIYVPKVEALYYPILLAIPLQLFAYYIADKRECDIDKPRNLAKSVTVE